jgi:nucleolar complex protein 2
MANTKATKKFQHRHLKDVLKQRKEIKKVKQKQVLRDKRKARSKDDNGSEDETKEDKDIHKKALKDMSVDEFFQSGFDIPERPNKKRKRPSAAIETPVKKASIETNGSVEEDELSAEDEEENSDDEIPDAGGVMEAAEGEISVSEDEEEDDEAHKKTLESLAKNDPEFYKFLKDNDAELLDFEDDDLEGLEISDDEDGPRKKTRTEDDSDVEEEEDDEEEEEEFKNVLTIETVNKWEESITKNKSLRTAREVVLAFRSAVHLNENNGKNYKYAVTTSDGKYSSCINFRNC